MEVNITRPRAIECGGQNGKLNVVVNVAHGAS